MVVLLVSWAPKGLRRLPLSLAMICVGLGAGIFSFDILSFNPDPRTWDTVTERLTELVVIISLMGAGLKLDRPVSLKGWGPTWRLLVIAMPLTIAATAWLGVTGLGFSLAMALLLGAAMAPTDPVLASDVQTGPPGSGEENEVRFNLTAEAGLNDALAFPFVNLAILVSLSGAAAWAGQGLFGYLSLIGSPLLNRDKVMLAYLGIRGLGSVYYVAYALNHGTFGDSERLWAITGFVVLTSILVHGVTATPLMALIERLGGRSLQGRAAPANAAPKDEQLG